MKNKSKELDLVIQELKDTWDFTTEELTDIREKIKSFTWDCLMDSDFRNSLLNETGE